MSSDDTILEEMLERATNPDQESDELSKQMFCIVVRSNSDLVHKAQELLIKKIRSDNLTIAFKAIALLGECMAKGGTEFQDEAAKFRFLNELIRLISNRHGGSQTPTELKQRLMESLLLWTTEYPEKTKIREAYEMLCKEGILDKDNKHINNLTKRENVLGKDEEVFAGLIKSKNPENLKRANLLVQHRVAQEARKMELISQHKSLLQEINNIVVILNQMLDTYSEKDEDAAETMKELYKNCKKHKPILKRMPELLDKVDEALLADTLETNDLLQSVMTRYKNTLQSLSETPSIAVEAKNETSSTDLLKDVFSSLPNETPKEPSAALPSRPNLEELSDIFGSINSNDETKEIYPKSALNLLSSAAILEPSKVYSPLVETSQQDPQHLQEKDPKKPDLYALEEIDKISEELLKKNLEKVEALVAKKKESKSKNPSLNDLAKEKIISSSKSSKDESESPPSGKEEVVVPLSFNDLKEDELCLGEHPAEPEQEPQKVSDIKPEPPKVHLSDINIDLDEITPFPEELTLLDDNDLQIKMVYTENRPSKNISVIVLTALNKSKMEINNFQIEASVKKPSKVRLLPATDTYMAPKKPFRQVNPINQVLLLLNPTGEKTNVTLLVGYQLDKDPDPIKESIVIKDIPYVD